VNYFGTATLTHTLLPLLRRSALPGGARVVTVSSSAGSLSSWFNDVNHPARKVFYLPILTLQGLDDLVGDGGGGRLRHYRCCCCCC
jgi:NAD(P)-dependent dehydrogenase (short-subunit alcohol dehydrogenase family)